MINITRKQERYLRDPLPIRLAGLAADLARVSSSAHHLTGAKSVATMLKESQYFIEWTASETEPEVAAELVDIQRMIALWRKAWLDAQINRTQRTLFYVQAKKWSELVLRFSGLVE